MLKAAVVGLVLSVSGFANAGLISASDTYNEFGSLSTSQNGFTWQFSNLPPAASDLTFLFSWERMDFSAGEYMDIFLEGTLLGRIGGGTSTSCLAANGGSFNSDCFGTINFETPSLNYLDDGVLNLVANQTGVNSSGGVHTDSPYGFVSARVSYNAVPEPSTLAIFALGIMGLAARRFKKQ